MRIIFMGTPGFAATSLETLLQSDVETVAVVTSPDKPAGRGLQLRESAVKECALKHKLPVLQPEKLKDPVFLESLRSFQADLFVVVAFRMLPEEVWKMPPLGTVNLHGSLLPQYRGAAPINWAIINGETRTGTTVFFIDKEIDTGSIISYDEQEIYPEDDAGSLYDRLMQSGAVHLTRAVQSIAEGTFKAVTQNPGAEQGALKHAPKIFKETCKIDWNDDATKIHNLVRGLSPYPGAWTTFVTSKNERRMFKILKTSVQPADQLSPPGTVDSDNRTCLRIAAENGWVIIESLQPEGKKRMDILDFLRGVSDIGTYQTKPNDTTGH